LAVFARAHGELSAATAGQAGTYHARCAALGLRASAGDAEGRLAGLWDQGHKDAAALGTPIAGPAASELTAVLEELNAPGPFLALVHGDAESNNILVADARLIGFEAAGYAHALIDAVCLHVPGPGWLAGPGAQPMRCAAAGPTRTWTLPTGRGSRPIRRAVNNVGGYVARLARQAVPTAGDDFGDEVLDDLPRF
jgi:hypothetical protein